MCSDCGLVLEDHIFDTRLLQHTSNPDISRSNVDSYTAEECPTDPGILDTTTVREWARSRTGSVSACNLGSDRAHSRGPATGEGSAGCEDGNGPATEEEESVLEDQDEELRKALIAEFSRGEDQGDEDWNEFIALLKRGDRSDVQDGNGNGSNDLAPGHNGEEWEAEEVEVEEADEDPGENEDEDGDKDEDEESFFTSTDRFYYPQLLDALRESGDFEFTTPEEQEEEQEDEDSQIRSPSVEPEDFPAVNQETPEHPAPHASYPSTPGF